MAVYKGVARIRINDLLGASLFRASLATANNDPDVLGSDRAVWELAAGQSVTLRLRIISTGSNPVVVARVYYETGTGTLIRQLRNSTSGSGTLTYTFYATDDGTATGTPCVGTMRLYVRAYREGSLNDFDIDSDGNVSGPALGGSAGYTDQGVLRAYIDNPTLSHLGYPAGSQHAYGAAGDEFASLRVGYTPPPTIRGHEQTLLRALTESGGVAGGGTTQLVSAGGTSDHSVRVDELAFNSALESCGARVLPVGTALIVPDSEPGMLWTRFVADTGQVQSGDGVQVANLFDVDPRLTAGIVQPTPDSGLANIGDAISVSMQVTNSRDELLTRPLTTVLRDSTGATIVGNTQTGPSYTQSHQLVAGDDATADTTGAQWTLEVEPVTVATVQVNAIRVSTFRVFHSANGLPGFDANLADGMLTSAETTTSDDGGGGDRSLLNRGEECRLIGYVYRADGGYWTRPLDMRVIADDNSEEDQQSVSPLLGQIDYTYTTAMDDRANPTGRAKHARIADTDGNIEVNAPDQWNLSSRYRRTVVKVRVGDENGDDGRLGGVFPLAAFNRDSGEQPVYIEVEVRYFRDTLLANTTITAEARNDVLGVEDSQSVTTDANGIAAWSYQIGQGDKATPANGKLVPSLSPKHPHVYDAGNDSAQLPDWWGVTEHVWLDAHDQRAEVLSKDTWNPANPQDGSEDANEEPVGYVLLGDEMWLSVHAMGVRLDRELQTSGNAITQTLKAPNGSAHVMQQTDTGADGWSAPWNAAFTTPQSENWSHEAAFAFEGNSNTVADAITVITPRTNNLVPILVVPNILEPDTALGIQLRTEKDDLAIEPDSVPTFRVMDPSTSPWTELAAGNFTSDASGFEEANGSEYTAAVASAALPSAGAVAVIADAKISGSKIRVRAPVWIGRTAPDSYVDFDPAGEQWLRYVA